MKHMKKLMIIMGLMTCLNVLSCSNDHFKGPDKKKLSNTIILEWNEIAYEVFGGEKYQNSLMASRINAMVHLAMHDAINATYSVYASYAFKGRDESADPIAAAAAAAHSVLSHEIVEKKAFLDSALQKSLSKIAEGESKKRGLELGKEAALAIIAARSNDGSDGNPISPVAPSTTPGVYQAVPPFDFVFAPFWGNIKPFGLQTNQQFRSILPPSLNSVEYVTAFNEVKEMGKLNSTSSTSDQKAYSRFWYEFSEAGWNRVARTIAENKKLNLFETARLFALVDMAMADAYIAGWESKFYYNLWRPYTAIRHASRDDNDNTIEDSQWEPAMPTPPVQDYPSTHSALGNAAAGVIASIVGDHTPFTMSSPTALPANSTRSFTSLSQAADENADSRVMAGIHFRFACTAGQRLGDQVAEWVVSNHLKPLKKSKDLQ